MSLPWSRTARPQRSPDRPWPVQTDCHPIRESKGCGNRTARPRPNWRAHAVQPLSPLAERLCIRHAGDRMNRTRALARHWQTRPRPFQTHAPDHAHRGWDNPAQGACSSDSLQIWCPSGTGLRYSGCAAPSASAVRRKRWPLTSSKSSVAQPLVCVISPQINPASRRRMAQFAPATRQPVRLIAFVRRAWPVEKDQVRARPACPISEE